jgi:hypothetical protein
MLFLFLPEASLDARFFMMGIRLTWWFYIDRREL